MAGIGCTHKSKTAWTDWFLLGQQTIKLSSKHCRLSFGGSWEYAYLTKTQLFGHSRRNRRPIATKSPE